MCAAPVVTQLLFFFFVACIAYDPSAFEPAEHTWPEYFAIPVLALVTITILNDGTLIAVAYDNVEVRLMHSHVMHRWGCTHACCML